MRKLLGALILTLLAVPAFAQTAADCTGTPTGTVNGVGSTTPRIAFTKSVDHDAVVGGVTVLTSYAVAVCQGTTLVTQGDIGKPTPNTTTNEIIAPLPGGATLKPNNTTYYVVLYAKGPAGTSKTAPAFPFVLAGPPAVGNNIRVIP